MTMIFLDPRQGSSVGTVIPAKRLDTFTNKRLGLLWNSKHGGDILLKEVAEILNQKYRFAEIYFTRKMFFGNAAPPEIINDLVDRVDVVVTSLGD